MSVDLSRLTKSVLERSGSKEGAEIQFLCPAHDDTKPSAHYNPNKGVWHCFTCGEDGGYLDLTKRLGVDLRNRQPNRKRNKEKWLW